MLFKKLWRTMGLYKAQFISMILMVTLGIGIFVGFNMEWVSIEANMMQFFDRTGYADFRLVSEAGITQGDARKIAAIDGVDAVSRYLCVTAEVTEQDGDTLALMVTENADVSGMQLMDGDAYDADSADGIWLGDKYAAANGIRPGDTLTLTYKGLTLRGTVRGLVKSGEQLICVRDETQLMPDYNTHGFAYISPKMYEQASGADYYPQLHVRSAMTKQAFTEAADDALGRTLLIVPKADTPSYSQAEGEADEGRTMGSVLPTLFLLIAVLTMVTTMHRLTAKEKTQIGTLKALGFKDRRILLHYTSYAFAIGVIGTVLGSALGYAVAWYIMNPNGMMGTYLDLPEWRLIFPGFCAAVLAGILVVLTLIGYLSVKQMLRGTAADALRPYTPKQMKPLLIERTRWFHKLSFGTRWNLRDMIRHKSRTAMSLLGIVGCAVLVTGALGMRDTMQGFLDMYYGADGAMGYASRIYLAETADDAARRAVVDAYDGDWSATISVQVADEATVSLDVCSVTHDLLRFPAQQSGVESLRDNGALICSRIADEFGLAAGDSITFSPYGSDDTYTVPITAVVRSVTKSISITPACAERIGLDYTVDSVYTRTEKSAIPSDTRIKSVQSKQMIVDSFDVFLGMMNSSIMLLVVAALALGIIVLYNLGVMSYTERFREMATLKVVGFKDRKIGALLIGQNLWLSLLGVMIGIPCGYLTLKVMLDALCSEYEMRAVIAPATYLFSIALTVGMSLLVSAMVSRKNRKIDMVEALKGAE